MLGPSRSRQDNGFVHFHRTVYRVLRWLAQQTGAVDAAQIKAEFDARWAETGPVGNPLEAVYRTSAEQMLERERHRSRAGMRVAETESVRIGGHSVRQEQAQIARVYRPRAVGKQDRASSQATAVFDLGDGRRA
ncbi:hypothetical protein [Bradyrhizobium retamae]|uniref:hypothetical protein n=1 Tax=Bradyrhizobium retamae TaxID=1300035 RepID=UPI0012E3C150|nr:hypothetical protein [Bradyrhizobium retamae]